MSFVEPKLSFPKFNEHAQKKGMWAGSQVNSEHMVYIRAAGEKIFKNTKLNYSAAMYKYYDEIIINMIDQYMRCVNAPQEYGGSVDTFIIEFDKLSGIASFRNNGPGIPVELRPDLGGKYSVEGVITKEFGGSNHDDNPDGVTGGINGVGMKIVVANSEYFEIETVDYKRGIYYKQICRDGMNVIEPPTVIDLKDMKSAERKALSPVQRSPHTTVKFKLNFANVCKDNAQKPNTTWYTPQHAELIERLIEYRVYQIAIFLRCATYRTENSEMIEYKNPITIKFNKTDVKVANIEEFAKMFGMDESVSVTINGPNFPWTLCFADNVSRNKEWGLEDPKETLNSLGEESMSIINGIHISLKSNHLRPIISQLVDYLLPKAETALKTKFTSKKGFENLLRKFIYIFDCRHIPVAQIFNSQTKDTISLPVTTLNAWLKDYELPTKTMNEVWKMICPKLEFLMLTQPETKKRRVGHIRKYTPAKHAKQGDKLAHKCALIIPEGDSAAKPMEDILKSKKYGLGMDLHGLYNIQGVPPNAIKETTEKIIGGKRILQKSAQLQKNISFQGLVDAVNLNYDFEYYTGPDKARKKRGDEEFATLNYSSIIAAVDQDLDGIGQIFSLIIVFIARFWPHLMERGFVRRFATPIIRVYAKTGHVYEFFSNGEYLDWKNKQFGTEVPDQGEEDLEDQEDGPDETEEIVTDKLPAGYKTKYYKGLATHTPEEVAHMGKTFLKNIFTYVWDPEAEHYMDIYFGKDADKRKDVLANPISHIYDPILYQKRMIKCSDHFRIEAHAQKLDFVSRKLKHALDGMIPVQRMAFAGARKAFRTNKAPKKVYQITGRVTTEMCYEHGDTSMNDTIIKMAQNHTGACYMPLFVAISNGFGDRRQDRGTTGSARYIESTLNSRFADLLFPPEDDWLLQYEYKEGRQCEPKYYIGIVPYSIIESLNTPAAGWAITTWARDFQFVLEEVRQMIKYDGCPPMPMSKQFWKKDGMHIEYMVYANANEGNSEKVTEVCIGSYTTEHLPNGNTEITITQLPPQVWSKHFVANLMGIDPHTDKPTTKTGTKLEKDPKIISAQDMTCDDEVLIKITLRPGAYDEIMQSCGREFIDPIEDYFGLSKPLNNHINMILDNGAVRMFKKYEEVMEYWFDKRKTLYNSRLDRQRLLLQYEIDYHRNVRRFIEMDSANEICIDKMPQDERVALLQKHQFTKFNKARLFRPSYIPLAELHDCIYVQGASYLYIDQITVGQKSKRSVEKLDQKIIELVARYEHLLGVTYKTLWLEELEELSKTVDLGLRTNWLYTTKKHQFL